MNLMTTKTTFNEMKDSMDMMSAKYDEVLNRLDSQNTRVKTFEKEVHRLKSDVNEKSEKIEELESCLREMEQYNRNKSIEISGVVKTNEENVLDVMKNLSDVMQINFDANDVDVIHRVPTWKRDQTEKIIVQFKIRTQRNVWLKKKAKGIISSDVCGVGNDQIYINEHLTPYWPRLLWRAKVERKKETLHYGLVQRC